MHVFHESAPFLNRGNKSNLQRKGNRHPEIVIATKCCRDKNKVLRRMVTRTCAVSNARAAFKNGLRLVIITDVHPALGEKSQRLRRQQN